MNYDDSISGKQNTKTRRIQIYAASTTTRYSVNFTTVTEETCSSQLSFRSFLSLVYALPLFPINSVLQKCTTSTCPKPIGAILKVWL